MQILWFFIDLLFPPQQSEQTIYQAVFLSLAPRAEPHIFAWVFSLYSYKDPLIKKTIRILKKKKDLRIIKRFARELSFAYKEQLSQTLSIIPIPLSSERLHERGFNQSLLLAKALSRLHPQANLLVNTLIKTHDTRKQALIQDRNERQKNVIGCFSVINAPIIKGSTILLVDDVVTTGATLAEARKVLLEAGAKDVLAVTLAH